MTTGSRPADPGPRVAVVQAVGLYPLKGALGSRVDHVTLDLGGVVGDRRHVVTDDDGRVLTADRVPQLRSVAARLDGATLRLDVDGVARDLAGADAEAALSALLGRTVHLVRVDQGSQVEAPVHLVSAQALEAARRGDHEAAGCACSLTEPRANLVLDLVPGEAPSETPGETPGDAPVGAPAEPPGEAFLVGRTVSAGSAVLRVHRRPEHCLGLYAEVVTPGQVAAGDAVRLLG